MLTQINRTCNQGEQKGYLVLLVQAGPRRACTASAMPQATVHVGIGCWNRKC